MKEGQWYKVVVVDTIRNIKFKTIEGNKVWFSERVDGEDYIGSGYIKEDDWFLLSNMTEMTPSNMHFVNEEIEDATFKEGEWYCIETKYSNLWLFKLENEEGEKLWNSECYDMEQKKGCLKRSFGRGFFLKGNIITKRKATQKEIDDATTTHIDVPINWEEEGVTLIHPFGFAEELYKIPVGMPMSKYILSGFKFKESGEVIKDSPVKYNKGGSRTSIRSRATHSRFIGLRCE